MRQEGTIPLDKCKPRHLYRLWSRNLAFGVFHTDKDGFIGIRTKFGAKFLFTEYHWDYNGPYGTACPLEDLGPMPDNIEVNETSGPVDKLTRRPVSYDPDAKSWRFTDTNELDDNIHAIRIENQPLFDWLTQVQGTVK